jgi:WhiB family redox-sensing transcriptional regulator
MSERLLTNPNWYEQANCSSTDPEALFPTDRHGVALAKKICANCVVVNDCLTDALRNELTERDVHGIAGGLSAEERKRMRGFEE